MIRIKIEIAGNDVETHLGDASLQLHAYARDPQDLNDTVVVFLDAWNIIYDSNCRAETPRPTTEEAHEQPLSAGDQETSTPEEESDNEPRTGF